MRFSKHLTILGALVIVAWGLISVRPSPASASHIGMISAGGQHSCLLTTAVGGVKCWGRNDFGQLGNGSYVDSSALVDVTGLQSGVVAVASGAVHSCALLESGDVQCWGGDDVGAIGDGTSGGDQLTPATVVGLSDVVAVSGGFHATCALTGSGGAKCWGMNNYGQLGASTAEMCGSDSCSSTPLDVTGLTTGVLAVSAGEYHACAVTAAHTVKCWGHNDEGQLGDGTNTDRSTPVDVTGLTDVAIVQAAAGHTCALKTNGAVLCWGANVAGQLGNPGAGLASNVPVAVTGLSSGVAAISAQNGAHTCALMSTGNVKCWGFNTFGQVGNGSTGFAVTTPVDVVYVNNDVVQISAGAMHTCALRASGSITCWGDNLFAQLGDSDGDGCTDSSENGTNPMLGGQRSAFYPWDFFDTPDENNVRDGTINLPGDILRVSGRFGATGDKTIDPFSAPPASGYHPAFDRGPQDGPYGWNRAPADGTINLPDDILGIASQFGHTCA